jgi:hypothetical protein
VRFEPREQQVHIAQVAEAGPGGAAACSAHPANASVTSCGRCGVFMCALCRIDIDAQVLCPACFDRLSQEGVLPGTRVEFKDYQRMAAIANALAFLMWPFAALFGAVGFLYGIFALRQRRRFGESEGVVKAWAMIVVGAVATLGGLALFVVFFTSLAEP